MGDGRMQIGEVAARTSVSVETVRYYEKCGLLRPAPRTPSGYRVFYQDAVERILFIKQAQELGFSLDEVRSLLAVGGAEECRRVQALLKLKLDEVDQRIRSMRAFRNTLARHLVECEKELSRNGSEASCPILIDVTQVSREDE